MPDKMPSRNQQSNVGALPNIAAAAARGAVVKAQTGEYPELGDETKITCAATSALAAMAKAQAYDLEATRLLSDVSLSPQSEPARPPQLDAVLATHEEPPSAVVAESQLSTEIELGNVAELAPIFVTTVKVVQINASAGLRHSAEFIPIDRHKILHSLHQFDQVPSGQEVGEEKPAQIIVPQGAVEAAGQRVVDPRDGAVLDTRPEDMRANVARPKRRTWWRTGFAWLRRFTRLLAYGAIGYAVLCVALIFVYRYVDPPASNLMLWQHLKGVDVSSEWVPLSQISPNLVKAVIASEDARFCSHGGVDFQALRAAVKLSGTKRGRGASTISMQVTKNLFLWNSRSYIRKAIEIPLTMGLELVWPKWRVMEVYLNIAEWGEGVFGAEAAASYHFDESARDLSRRQAALLAVSLPNPAVREAGDPNRQTRRRASTIERRVRGSVGAAKCVLK